MPDQKWKPYSGKREHLCPYKRPFCADVCQFFCVVRLDGVTCTLCQLTGAQLELLRGGLPVAKWGDVGTRRRKKKKTAHGQKKAV